MLPAGQFTLPRAVLMRMEITLGDVMAVARLQLFQHRLSRRHRLLRRECDTATRNSSKHAYHRGRHEMTSRTDSIVPRHTVTRCQFAQAASIASATASVNKIATCSSFECW